MGFTTNHDVQRGLERLLSAPRDLPQSAPWREPPLEHAAASQAHRSLFRDYEEEMEELLDIAEQWWEDGIQRRKANGDPEAEIMEDAYRRSFAGPAGLSEMVWTIRKFWIACVAINEELPEAQRVPPEVFLLHWLDDGEHTDHIQVLTGMPYWPIGLDADGHWV